MRSTADLEKDYTNVLTMSEIGYRQTKPERLDRDSMLTKSCITILGICCHLTANLRSRCATP